LYIKVAAVCRSLWADIAFGSSPEARIYFLTTFWIALVVIRVSLREINKALVVTLQEFLICNQLLIDLLTAGVKKILRSLFPLPMTLMTSLSTWSRLRLASSDKRKAQFKKIVIIQYDLLVTSDFE